MSPVITHRRNPLSHTVTIKTEVRDAAAVRAACDRLRLPAPVQGKAKLYDREIEGLAVRLPGWDFPAVANLSTGQLAYDNFNGYWGDQKGTRSLPPSLRRREMPHRGPPQGPPRHGTTTR